MARKRKRKQPALPSPTFQGVGQLGGGGEERIIHLSVKRNDQVRNGINVLVETPEETYRNWPVSLHISPNEAIDLAHELMRQANRQKEIQGRHRHRLDMDELKDQVDELKKLVIENSILLEPINKEKEETAEQFTLGGE